MHNTSNFTANLTQAPTSLTTIAVGGPSHYDTAWFFWLQIVLFSILMLVVVLGNMMVLSCLLTIKEMRTVTGLFLTNLAITDLGVGFISIPLSLAASIDHFLLHKKWFCILQGSFLVLFLLASLLTLGFLSLQKYINVGYNTFNRFNKKHAKYTIIGVWIVAVAVALAPTLGWSTFRFSKGGHQCAPYQSSSSGHMYLLFLLVVGIIIPTVTMIFCYWKLYMMIRTHLRSINIGEISCTTVRSRRNLSSVESKLIHTLIIMMVAFFICWLPAIVMFLLKVSQYTTPHLLEMAAVFCAYASSAVNPILYVMRQQDFQDGFRKIMKDIFDSCILEHPMLPMAKRQVNIRMDDQL